MSPKFTATTTLICAALLACANHDESEANVGVVGLSVTTAPNDVNCLVIKATGSGRTVTRSIDVTPGQAITTPVDGLPTGTVSVSAYAYPTVCSAVTSTSVANWMSDPVSQVITLTTGTVVPLQLVLRPNGSLLPKVDWQYDGAGGAGGTGGTSGGGAGGSTVTCNDTSSFTTQVTSQWGYAFVPVNNSVKRYVMYANWWGAYAGQVENVNGIGFTIPTQTAVSSSASPLGFPSLYIGNYGGRDASAGTNLPRLVSALTTVPVVFQSNATSIDSSNIGDGIEAWLTPTATLSPTAASPGAGGAILKLWLHKPTARQPSGSVVGTATLAGNLWNVWVNRVNPPIVTYVSATPLANLSTDLKPFVTHAMANAYGVTSSQYLSVIFGGFDIWGGGSGLSLRQFCAQVN